MDHSQLVATAFPIPPFSESSYLNTGPEARYIGSAACAGCHLGNHESYKLTPHSKALSDLNLNNEPMDGSFEHKASGRSYRVYRKDGQLHIDLAEAYRRLGDMARSKEHLEIAKWYQDHNQD